VKDASMRCFLGIDLGTSAAKVIVVDESGRQRALRAQGYPILHPQPGYAEQSPEVWWKSTCDCIREMLLTEGLSVEEIKSIGLSGQMHGLVLIDRHGRPLRNAIIWPDRRTAAICAEKAGDEKLFHAITGLPLATGFLAPSLEWVRQHEPEVYEEASCFMLPKDYVRFRLTGRIATEPTDASGTFLFDFSKRQWSPEMLDAFHVADRLIPEMVETVDVAGNLTREAALLTGLPEGTPVIAGGSDQTMAALALGVDRPGKVAVAISSGGTVITPIDTPRFDSRVHTLCHAYDGQWLMMGATLAAGLSLSWAGEKVFTPLPAAGDAPAAVDMEELSRWAGDIAAGANGLFFAPYLNGERTPYMDSNARGCFVGLTLSHTRAHMARAIMEGVAYSLVESVEIFRELGLPVNKVSCYAGGSRSRTWRQILADVLDTPVHWQQFADYSALGAAVAGARGLGVVIPLENFHGPANEILQPLPENAKTYGERRGTFKKIYLRLRDVFDEISRFPA